MKFPRHSTDIVVIAGRVTIRNPIRVLLLNPFLLPVMLSLLGVSVVFTIWPDLLRHNAIAFETQGAVHHIWHYSLLVGSLLSLFGMLAAAKWRLKAELFGLILLSAALAINLVAVISAAFDPLAGDTATSGLGFALRAGVLLGMLMRIYVVAFEPTIGVPVLATSDFDPLSPHDNEEEE